VFNYIGFFFVKSA